MNAFLAAAAMAVEEEEEEEEEEMAFSTLIRPRTSAAPVSVSI